MWLNTTHMVPRQLLSTYSATEELEDVLVLLYAHPPRIQRLARAAA